MSVFFRFWQQQDPNPRPGDHHADVLPLRHFDPLTIYKSNQDITILNMVIKVAAAAACYTPCRVDGKEPGSMDFTICYREGSTSIPSDYFYKFHAN